MTDWNLAKCLQGDPEAWFPDKGEPAWRAQRVCRELCPIQRDCLEAAVANREKHGIWGGVVAEDLHKIQVGRMSISAALSGSNSYLRRAA